MEIQEFSKEIVDRFTPAVIEDLAEQMKNAIEIKDRRYHFKHYRE